MEDYLKRLKERAKASKVYSPHQLTGLMLAEMLGDDKHKSLYIRLAKKYDASTLFSLARSIQDRKNVKNKGAYFMSRLYAKDEDTHDKK